MVLASSLGLAVEGLLEVDQSLVPSEVPKGAPPLDFWVLDHPLPVSRDYKYKEVGTGWGVFLVFGVVLPELEGVNHHKFEVFVVVDVGTDVVVVLDELFHGDGLVSLA